MARQGLRSLVSNTYRERGDALAGERIIAQARNIGRILVVPRTSTHRIQQTVLKSNVLCVIDRPFRIKQTTLQLKTTDS